MFSPDLEEVKKIAESKEYKRMPISYELFSDMELYVQDTDAAGFWLWDIAVKKSVYGKNMTDAAGFEICAEK